MYECTFAKQFHYEEFTIYDKMLIAQFLIWFSQRQWLSDSFKNSFELL